MATHHNMLRDNQKFELHEYLKAKYVKDGRMTHDDPDVAAYASRDLGFTVSPGNIRGWRKARNVEPHRNSSAPRTAAGSAAQRLDRIEAFLKEHWPTWEEWIDDHAQHG